MKIEFTEGGVNFTDFFFFPWNTPIKALKINRKLFALNDKFYFKFFKEAKHFLKHNE